MFADGKFMFLNERVSASLSGFSFQVRNIWAVSVRMGAGRMSRRRKPVVMMKW
jgi:hypothetical protein